MLIIGLTGGIATGKSTISQRFQENGIPIVDADKIAREILEPGQKAYKQVLKHFGNEILMTDSDQIDRQKLGAIIFNDRSKREILNKCTHPVVKQQMLYQVAKYYMMGYRMCVLDVPLLIEARMDKFCSKIVVVDCDRDIQLDRLMRRDSIDRDVAESKINAQLSMGYKKSLASCVINNNGSKQEALEKVDSIVMEWMPSRFRTFGFLVAPFTILVGLSSILAVGKTWAGMWSIKLGSAWLVSSFLLN